MALNEAAERKTVQQPRFSQASVLVTQDCADVPETPGILVFLYDLDFPALLHHLAHGHFNGVGDLHEDVPAEGAFFLLAACDVTAALAAITRGAIPLTDH